MKPIALYLPQFHEIKENNEWWGKGYTEWNAVKNAKPLYKTHVQPRIPLNNNYYDLSREDGSVWKWQAGLARKYGLYGFCIYHYWFYTGEQLLEKPMEILLNHKEIDINYCICWANETWKRTWYSSKNEILKEQKYGDKCEWENHFKYLLPFFFDERYIKVNNKPVICIYHTNKINQLNLMVECWNVMAKNSGFSGVYIVSCNYDGNYDDRESIDAYYDYEPWTSLYKEKYKPTIIKKKIYGKVIRKYNEVMNKNKPMIKLTVERLMRRKKERYYKNKKVYLGVMPAFDDTPRRPQKATIITSTPKQFFRDMCKIREKLVDGNNDDFVFINAWNEWGEGAYLEPDEIYEDEYLKALKKAVEGLETEIKD